MAMLTGSYDLSIPNPISDIHVCWVPILDKMTWMQYAQMGYQPCTHQMVERMFGKEMAAAIRDENGYARFKDLVLCYISQDEYLRYEYEVLKQHAERRALTKEQFFEMVDKLGPSVKAFAMDVDDYLERKKFDQREGKNNVSFNNIDIAAIMAEARKVAREELAKAQHEEKAVTSDASAANGVTAEETAVTVEEEVAEPPATPKRGRG